MTITSYRCSRNVPLSLQISRIFLSSRRKEDEGAVNLYYYLACVVWHCTRLCLAAWQHRFFLYCTKSVDFSYERARQVQCAMLHAEV
jgi:hypothetical protein